MLDTKRIETAIKESRGFAAALDVACKLIEQGFKAYLVGGALRDIIIGFEPKDYDIATNASAEYVCKNFSNSERIYPNEYQASRIKGDSFTIEIARMRRDIKTFGRQAQVEFTDDIKDDLHRRDFTINAIALEPTSYEIIDPFNGCLDLNSGIVRTVGAPDFRFIEDHLRILRAIRFAAQLNFDIEIKTAQSIASNSSLVSDLSSSWIWREFSKGIKYAHRFKMLLIRYNLWKNIFREECLDPIRNYDSLEDAVKSGSAEEIVWIIFFYIPNVSLHKLIKQIAGKIEFPRILRSKLFSMTGILDSLAEFDTLSEMQQVNILDSTALELSFECAKFIPQITKSAQKIRDTFHGIGIEPLISGGELIEMGFDGKSVGHLLDKIRLAQLGGELTSRGQIPAFLEKIII